LAPAVWNKFLMTTVTRFAPSPTGYLHLGHAYSALFAADAAADQGGRFVLRLEDIDQARCRPEFEHQIYDDLAWLGLNWGPSVRRQSDHFADYQDALDQLDEMALLYPCFCTRKDIQAEIAASGGAPHGPDGPLYPGTCRDLSPDVTASRIAVGEAYALRINMAAAVACAGPLSWYDREAGTITAKPERFGDVVLARKDTPTSYHLAVTWDDHVQGITLVTRGQDLFAATDVHRLLQSLLNLNVPDYHHHRLLTDDDGERYAKRNRSVTLKSLRDAGKTPGDIRTMVSL
jgi:glutamyl-Q tRNA(Asp) synthetase